MSEEVTNLAVNGKVRLWKTVAEGESTHFLLRFEHGDSLYVVRLNPRLEGTVYKETRKNGEIHSMQEAEITSKRWVSRDLSLENDFWGDRDERQM